MRQLSIWSSATESRTSLRSSSFCFREWTSWSLVRRRRSAKAFNASQGSAEFADSTDFSHIQSLVPINAVCGDGRTDPDRRDAEGAQTVDLMHTQSSRFMESTISDHLVK